MTEGDRTPRDDSVWIGGQTRVDGQVHLADYDPAWPQTYEREAARIRAALGPAVRLLEHAGSTSVPGLPAKPIIDIVLAVPNSADESAYVPALAAAGYRLKVREPDWFEHRCLKSADPAVNLHVFTEGSEEIDRMLAFRDWLRSHPEDRELYLRTKRDLAARDWVFIQDYADAKSAVIAEINERAQPGPGT